MRECASIAFDSAGRLVSVCVGIDRPVLAMLDPQNLNALATMPLPPRNLGGSQHLQRLQRRRLLLSRRAGPRRGADHRPPRPRSATQAPAAPAFSLVRDFDVTGAVPQGDALVSVLPDWSGRIWFISREGRVGAIDRNTGAVKVTQLAGEGISNSFSVDETGGVFVVSDRALYRFDAGPGGEPVVSWREPYPNSGIHKPGQSDAGSGRPRR